jgi:hypothetical protein
MVAVLQLSREHKGSFRNHLARCISSRDSHPPFLDKHQLGEEGSPCTANPLVQSSISSSSSSLQITSMAASTVLHNFRFAFRSPSPIVHL